MRLPDRRPDLRLWVVRAAIRRRWLELRGRAGEFDVPEDSERCLSMTRTWQETWPGTDPIGYRLRHAHAERWVRFHTLPHSKRYADSLEERAEILRRQHTVLGCLPGANDTSRLIVIAEDWDARDMATGSSRRYVPGAWPWRRVEGDRPDDPATYLWVGTGLNPPQLDALLTAAADDRACAIISNPELGWLFYPYDGGIDVVLPDPSSRDALRDRHADWISPLPSGL